MLLKKSVFCKAVVFCCTMVCVSIVVVPLSFAQEIGIGIAQTYTISDEGVIFGDIISSRGERAFYHLTEETGDEKIFGVVVAVPALVLETTTGGLPVVSSGEVAVNVTTLGGPIATGDLITSSPIPGKGQRANDSDLYVLGVALEDFDGQLATTTLQYNDQEVATGSVNVLLAIGPRQQALEQVGETLMRSVGEAEAAQLNILRHIVATFVALGSVYFAFRNFGSNVKTGVISIGRNPLAKRSIQSMVVLNIILVLLVSAIGLFAALAIILLPI